MPGQVIFIYNEDNCLQQLIISETISRKQYEALFSCLPWHYSMMPALRELAKESTFIEQTIAITFEMFWNRYNDKDRSSKKKTQTMWDKMPITEQTKAFIYIPTYNRNRGAAEKKYTTTYLSDALWNN
jgi:hypothetical protein